MVIGLSKRIPQTVGVFLFIFIGILSAKITPRCYVRRTVTSSNHIYIYVPGIFRDLTEGGNDYPVLKLNQSGCRGARGICATNYF